MTAKTTRAVQTPGETPTPTAPATGAQAPAAGGTPPADAFQAIGTTDGGATDGDELSPAELRAMIAAQAAQIDALTVAVQNVSRAQNPARAVAEELPDIDSLDKATITSPVLTKQGWYVPHTYGTNPAAPKF